jgi:hypothetical protein
VRINLKPEALRSESLALHWHGGSSPQRRHRAGLGRSDSDARAAGTRTTVTDSDSDQVQVRCMVNLKSELRVQSESVAALEVTSVNVW